MHQLSFISSAGTSTPTRVNTSDKRAITAFRDFFISVGVPIKFWSDNSLFKFEEFKEFLKEWGVTSGLSFPHFLQPNEIAETGIKSMKKLIAASWTAGSFNLDNFWPRSTSLQQHRRSGCKAPTQMVFQRPVQDCLPAHRRSFTVEWQKDADVLKKWM